MSGEEGMGSKRPQGSFRGIKAYVPSETYIEMVLATQYGMIAGGPKTLSQLMLEGFECWKQQHPKVVEYIKTNRSILEKAMKGEGGQEGEKA